MWLILLLTEQNIDIKRCCWTQVFKSDISDVKSRLTINSSSRICGNHFPRGDVFAMSETTPLQLNTEEGKQSDM